MAVPQNPSNAQIVVLTVAEVRADGVVLARADGTQVTDVPAPATFAVEAGARVQAYLTADGRLNGWMPLGADFGSNLRRWAPPAGYDPVAAECFGPCGVVWEAPAAEDLVQHGERCLECNGTLEVRPSR